MLFIACRGGRVVKAFAFFCEFEYELPTKFFLWVRVRFAAQIFKSRTRIRIFRRQIWIPELTRIKTYMDTLGVRNTSSETFISAVCSHSTVFCCSRFTVVWEDPLYREFSQYISTNLYYVGLLLNRWLHLFHICSHL